MTTHTSLKWKTTLVNDMHNSALYITGNTMQVSKSYKPVDIFTI